MKPQLQPLDASAAPSTALYPALTDAEPAVRAKQLAGALHWDRSVPAEKTAAVTLKDCLENYLGTDRRGLIDAYWVCRHRAAVYQVLAQQVEWLADLTASAIEQRGQPLGAESMLGLRAIRLGAEADLLEAEALLARSQFDLTRLAGRPTDSAWLLASTAPHAGPYDLKDELRSRQLSQSWPLRRAAAMVPSLWQSLAEYGTAVVGADAARDAAAADYQRGRRSLDAVLAAIDTQTRQTLAFLQTLTDYNQAIADYALAVLPPDLPAGHLVQTLVVPQAQAP